MIISWSHLTFGMLLNRSVLPFVNRIALPFDHPLITYLLLEGIPFDEPFNERFVGNGISQNVFDMLPSSSCIEFLCSHGANPHIIDALVMLFDRKQRHFTFSIPHGMRRNLPFVDGTTNEAYDTDAMVQPCAWHHSISKGMRVDLLDFNYWRAATIVDTRYSTSSSSTTTSPMTTECLIQLKGWFENVEIWLPVLSSRLSPNGSRGLKQNITLRGLSSFDRLRSSYRHPLLHPSSPSAHVTHVERPVTLGMKRFDYKREKWIKDIQLASGILEPLARLAFEYFGTIIYSHTEKPF
jgi:hypothetical protein